jgi:hypothetical protein
LDIPQQGQAAQVARQAKRLSPRAGATIPASVAGDPTFASTITAQRDLRSVDWYMDVARNVDRVRSLKAGWDGPGSDAIDPALLYRASKLVYETLASIPGARAPLIAPIASGGVQIEWHTLAGDLEYEFSTSGNAMAWARDGNTGDEFEASGLGAFDLFLRWAPRMAARPVDEGNVLAAAESANFEIAA